VSDCRQVGDLARLVVALRPGLTVITPQLRASVMLLLGQTRCAIGTPSRE
jgi:hypothetical protein